MTPLLRQNLSRSSGSSHRETVGPRGWGRRRHPCLQGLLQPLGQGNTTSWSSGRWTCPQVIFLLFCKNLHWEVPSRLFDLPYFVLVYPTKFCCTRTEHDNNIIIVAIVIAIIIVSFIARFSFIASFIISVIAIVIVIVIYVILIMIIIRCFGTRTQWSWSRATASTWPAWATLISSTLKVFFLICNFISLPVLKQFFYVDYVDMCNAHCVWSNVDFGMWLLQVWLLQISRPPTMAAISAGIATWWSLLSINFQRKHISAANKSLMRTSGLFNLIKIASTTPWSQSFSVALVLILNRQFLKKRKKDPILSIFSPCHRYSLSHSLMFWRFDWCDSSRWKCQFKSYPCCWRCWNWSWVFQQIAIIWLKLKLLSCNCSGSFLIKASQWQPKIMTDWP